ncbi:hypothetical protein TNCV_160991 [Trichonephila clavipes]|nr:hypothetical protein TNCV_160991 [Trichonephila clavipes]
MIHLTCSEENCSSADCMTTVDEYTQDNTSKFVINQKAGILRVTPCTKSASEALISGFIPARKPRTPVLCKKANGAMKTSSVEFISRSPNPLPMKSEHRRFVLSEKFLSLGSGSEGKREIVLNRRPEL